ncbi:MAG: 3-hydroxyacyl-ACP dehydratase FabZ [Candidatus Omnitrophica bacterium]|nr:3-hydroxyacyl-ACP dehydratase FabZ [Candidatus Omnitrophota bacterium]
MPAKFENEIAELVSEIIEIPADKIDPDKDFADLEVDSMKGLEIVAALERRFKITVPETEIPKARTLNKVIELARNLKQSGYGRMDKEKIKSILPHREPFLFIDEVVEIDEGRRIVAKKYIDPKEKYFEGHFPNKPIMPGALIIEAMAQASLILYYTAKPQIANTHPDYYLVKVNTELLSPVYPGDTLTIEAKSVKILDTSGIIETIAMVGDTVVAKTSGAFAVKPKKE